jgi:hypothetical protein
MSVRLVLSILPPSERFSVVQLPLSTVLIINKIISHLINVENRMPVQSLVSFPFLFSVRPYGPCPTSYLV